MRYSTDVLVVGKGEGIAGNALVSHQPVSLSEIPEHNYGVHLNFIKQLGLKSGMAIPLNKGGNTLAVMVFFGFDEQPPKQQFIDEFNSYANGLVFSGFMQQEVQFLDFTGISSDKVKSVYELIVAERVFNPRHIYQEVDCMFSPLDPLFSPS